MPLLMPTMQIIIILFCNTFICYTFSYDCVVPLLQLLFALLKNLVVLFLYSSKGKQALIAWQIGTTLFLWLLNGFLYHYLTSLLILECKMYNLALNYSLFKSASKIFWKGHMSMNYWLCYFHHFVWSTFLQICQFSNNLITNFEPSGT